MINFYITFALLSNVLLHFIMSALFTHTACSVHVFTVCFLASSYLPWNHIQVSEEQIETHALYAW
jgi:hypothetical protein